MNENKLSKVCIRMHRRRIFASQSTTIVNQFNLTTMTASQITKRLVKNEIALTFLTIEKNEIEIAVDYTEQNGYGSVNEKKTKALAKKIEKLFPEISHASIHQYGAISFSFNFTKCPLIANNID